ncbi:hypothetical protein HMPREF3213_03395 [Heyndrickxia coagulans]|uniref:Uncharacterized protein n=1 Tax=Heyndrickxia coagulans TaxID=1398 RepID=A0A0C5C9M7_HEYCO|nr:hypothetical protein SB48_HM08orf04399 [Heyndrickxia coagulans]KWZ77206.1 hypothetical protein HMPREF3213_03395 [Heyndrickxia coagulans]
MLYALYLFPLPASGFFSLCKEKLFKNRVRNAIIHLVFLQKQAMR